MDFTAYPDTPFNDWVDSMNREEKLREALYLILEASKGGQPDQWQDDHLRAEHYKRLALGLGDIARKALGI